MAYPKQLTESQKAAIRPIVEKIDTMKEGDLITVKDTPEALDELRYLLYAWLHHNSIKNLFRISKPSPTRLSLYRKIHLRPEIESSGVDPRIKEFITKSLLEVVNEDEAVGLIQKEFSSPIERATAHREWRRIMQGES